MTRLILALDSDQLQERERSTQQLECLGDCVEPHLRKVLAQTGDLIEVPGGLGEQVVGGVIAL